MNKEKDNIKFYLITGLISLSFLSRVISTYFFGDSSFDNEWGILLKNLINYKSFSYYVFDNQPVPSAYMPPMYAFFIYLIKLITFFEGKNLLYTVLFVQIILSTYSIYIFLKINQIFFSSKISLINSTIFSFIPINIYACGQISSINLQIILSLLFLYFLFSFIKEINQKNIIIFSVVSGMLMLTRGEFVIIFFPTILFIFLIKKIKVINLVKIILIVVLIVGPYTARNYFHFNLLIQILVIQIIIIFFIFFQLLFYQFYPYREF